MKASAILALFALGLAIPRVVSGQAPVVLQETGSKVLKDQAQAALDFHNKVRKDVGAPPLQWSAELAAVAQKWAEHLAHDNHCGLSHTPNDPHGENLFAGSGAAYTALDASQDWYGEIRQYKYSPVTNQNFAATGHYTQMVWATSTQVGIGQAICSDGGTVIAAEYDPHGNVIGQKPY